MRVNLELGCILAALSLLIQMHGVSLHYSAFFLSRLHVSVVFGPTYSIIFVASVNVIFSSSYFPVCVTEHYSIVCMHHVYPLTIGRHLDTHIFCEKCCCERVCPGACVSPAFSSSG